MGAWGTGIFQDDTACDIRDSYRDYLGEGVSGPDATGRILKEFSGILPDPHESGVVWMALAAVQWKHGRLEEETKAQALRVIESGTDLERWKYRRLCQTQGNAGETARSDHLAPAGKQKSTAKNLM